MNWDAVGALAEVLGATAVLATLIYLSIQIRESSKSSKAQTFHSLIDSMTLHRNAMYSQENVDLLAKAFNSYVNLEPREKMLIENLFANEFNCIETTFRHAKMGLVDQAVVDNWAWYLEHRLFPYRGAREWWEITKDGFQPEMQEWVNNILDDVDETLDPYGIQK